MIFLVVPPTDSANKLSHDDNGDDDYKLPDLCSDSSFQLPNISHLEDFVLKLKKMESKNMTNMFNNIW